MHTWYYLKASGKMATGWIEVGGEWYYMYPSGAMATDNGESGSGGGAVQTGTVYVTSSGSKYHSSSSCSNMKSPISTSLSTAIASGYAPCSKCW